MALWINDSGTWKEPTPWINDGGTWKEPSSVWINDAGTWKEVFSAFPKIYGIQDTQTFSSVQSTTVSQTMDIGTAHSDREIWVIVVGMASDNNPVVVSSANVGGQTLNEVFSEDGGNYTNTIGITYLKYQDDGSLGSSAIIDVTFENSQVHVGIVVVTSEPTSSLFDSYSAHANSSLATEGSINTTSSGWALGAVCSQNASSGGSIPNFGNEVVFDMGSDEWVAVGYNSPASGGSVQVENYTNASSANNTISAICME